MIENVMDHNIKFPIYVCLDDGEVMRVESFETILHHLEAIDIDNNEYLFWDAHGRGLKILTEKNAVSGFHDRDNKLSCRQAIKAYATRLAMPIDANGTLDEVRARVEKAKESLPRPQSFWTRLFGRCRVPGEKSHFPNNSGRPR
jgi:hypothetical protein